MQMSFAAIVFLTLTDNCAHKIIEPFGKTTANEVKVKVWVP